jgi:hypothetical protein
MDSKDLLLDAYARIQQTVHSSAEGLDEEWLAYRPEAYTNSIAWLVWHLTRVQGAGLGVGRLGREVWNGAGRDEQWLRSHF